MAVGQHGDRPGALLRCADTAMLHAKANGRDRTEFFNEGLRTASRHRLEVVSDLRRAVEREEFSLRFQPVVSLLDRTIIGAEANLAARLQSIAEPGGIVVSYETYALVRDMVRAQPLPPIIMKGISRKVVPYTVEGLVEELQQRANVISERATGIDFFLDLEVIDTAAAERARRLLQQALAALEQKSKRAVS